MSERTAWGQTLRMCLQLVVGTTCVVVVLLAMANKPDQTEVISGVAGSLVGSIGGWLAGRVLKGQSE